MKHLEDNLAKIPLYRDNSDGGYMVHPVDAPLEWEACLDLAPEHTKALSQSRFIRLSDILPLLRKISKLALDNGRPTTDNSL